MEKTGNICRPENPQKENLRLNRLCNPHLAACIDLFDPDKAPKNSGIRRWNDSLFLLRKETNGEILAGKALSVQTMLSENSRCVAVQHGPCEVLL